jgi:hypothetical protein
MDPIDVAVGFAATKFISAAAKEGAEVIEQAAVHGNSLKSLKPTWGYKLYSQMEHF